MENNRSGGIQGCHGNKSQITDSLMSFTKLDYSHAEKYVNSAQTKMMGIKDMMSFYLVE